MAVLAKLTPPRTTWVYPRERLFARLDECREHPAVWVYGPPGAGKTTLAASYIGARRLPALWYQVDAGDADPASFFYYLGLAAGHASASRKLHLPLLTPEYLSDVPGFTRRFFRQMCQALPASCVLVLDNYQDAPPSSPFNGLIRDALAEVPPGQRMLVLSRAEPPAELARLRATRAIAELGWQDLRLTSDEGTQIAASARRAPPGGIDALLQRCDGWAAGLTLLLDPAVSAGATPDGFDGTGGCPQALFDYFAAEIFDGLPDETRHVLLHTAWVPWVGADLARALSGHANAGQVLEAMRRRQLFVERRAGAEPSYRYHALLRDFLAARLRDSFSSEAQRELMRASAQALVQADDHAAALPLYLQAGEVPAAVQLVLGEAPRLAAQGRLQTLLDWIGSLPTAAVASVPWLDYWQGLCALATDPKTARIQLEAVFDRFHRSDDLLGQAVTAAGILETYNLEMYEFRPMDRWTDELHRLLDRSLQFPDPALEMNVLGSLMGALNMRQPAHPRLPVHAHRLAALLVTTQDVNARVGAAARLLHHYAFNHRSIESAQLIAAMRKLMSDPTVLPVHRCTWWHMESIHHQMLVYDAELGDRAIDAALDVVERYGLRFYGAMTRSRAAMFRLEAGDLSAAATHLRDAVPTLGTHRFDMGWFDGMCSWLALLEGREAEALACSGRLVDTCNAMGAGHSHFMGLLLHANALLANGYFERSMEALRLSRQTNVTDLPMGRFTADLIEADIHLRQGDSARAVGSLRRAMALGAKARLFNNLQWLAPQMSRLCGLALDREVEPAYVTELIQRRHLRPPGHASDRWPWPIRLNVLGAFQILKDGQPLRFEGKAQRKPMALLKALVVLGGCDVPVDSLIDILWAEPLEGDEQKAFDVTLHRLRKLLGHDKAILVSDRRLSLNPHLVWTDLWALDRLLSPFTDSIHAATASTEALEQATPAALHLYRGCLLDGEPEAAWWLPARERVHGRFQRFVLMVGSQREAAQQWEAAEALYLAAIDIEPGAEVYHRRLMVCLMAQGRQAEGIEAFQRCRRLLRATLGMAPSALTEATYQALLGS